MNNSSSGRKIVGSYITGILQCIFGGGGALVFGSLVAYNAFYHYGAYVLSRVQTIAFIVFFFVSFYFLLRGVSNCTMSSHSRRIQAVLAGKGREKLALIARVTRQDLTSLVRELRMLSGKGYFPGGYVDLYRRDFVVRSGGKLPPFTPGDTVLREVRKKSVFPIYAMGLVFVAYALVFPLHLWYHFAIALAAGLLVLIVLRRILPEHIVIVEEARKVAPPPPPPEAINTGNEELDAVLNAAMGYMQELTALDVAITNEKLDGPVMELVHICTQIFDYIRKTPSKVRQIRQFMNYYLPTTIKLLKTYDELSREPVKGENIRASMTKIENTMDSILSAFQKELDGLYQDKAMDIEVDIEVMQNMMEEEGLMGEKKVKE